MAKTVEYRVIPHDVWMIVRFEREDNQSGGSIQRGEFANEKEANEVAALLAKADEGAVFISRASLNGPLRNSVCRPTPIAGTS